MPTICSTRSVLGAVLAAGLCVLLTACQQAPSQHTATPEEVAAVKGVTAGLIADKSGGDSGQKATGGDPADAHPEAGSPDSADAQQNPGGTLSDAAGSKAAPDIPLPLAAGGTAKHLADYKGKVVVLDFWATWCGPCKMSIPGLEKIYAKYHSQGVEVFGISVDQPGSESEIKGVVNELGITYPIVLATGIPEVDSKYSCDSIPSVYLIDKAGRIRANIVGYDENSGEEQEIEALLKE